MDNNLFDEPFSGYILRNGKIKKVSFMEAALWFNNFQNRMIDRTQIGDDCHVSTVFLGFDHGFPGIGDEDTAPILFETMVFGGEYDERMWRYRTYGEAKRGHWQIVDCVRAGRPPEADRGERPFIDYFMEMMDNGNDTDTDGPDEDADPGKPEDVG